MQTAERTNKFLPVLVLLSTFLAASCAYDECTAENLKHLHNIELSLDRSISPCDDFYQYACGNYGQLMANSASNTMLGVVEGNFFANIKKILSTLYGDNRALKKHGQSFTDKLQTFVESCRNTPVRHVWRYLSVATPAPNLNWPLMEEIVSYQKLGRYVSPKAWNRQNKFDLFALLGQLSSYGLNHELISYAIQRTNGTTTFVLSMPDSSDLDITKVHSILNGTGLPKAVIEKYYGEIRETHKEWQTLYERYEDDDTAVDIHFDDLQEASPALVTFFKNLVPEKFLNAQAIFSIHHMMYFDYLEDRKWQSAETHKLCNYLMVRFLMHLISTVGYKECIDNAYHRMPLAMNYVYYRHEYLEYAYRKNEQLTKMLQKIYKHFRHMVAENRLRFNDAQMQEITTKLTNMITNIGNLPENVNATMVEEFYSALPDMDPKNFYQNELYLRKLETLNELICPPGMVCTDQLDHSPLNFAEKNIVAFPFASLKPPMYHSMYDPLFAYSLLGFIVGHEFGHAIDPGSLDSLTHFSTFNASSLDHAGVNASVTCMKQKAAIEFVDERVADAVGIQVAYRAYALEYGAQPNFISNPWQQMFFLNMAHFFCMKRAGAAEDHDGNELRVRQIAMNTEEFARAFQCPRGSKMNPEQKCRYI